MAFASANREGLYRVKETVWGVTPATPAWIETRMTGESIDANISTEVSKEIRQDRMVPDLVPVDSSPGGSFNIEMSAGSFDDLIESLMMSTWGSALGVAATNISVATGAGPHFTAATGTPFATVAVGQWVHVVGFTNAGNNGYFKVTAKTNTTLTVTPVPTTVEAAGASVTFDGSIIKNGVAETSWTFMKILNDATNVTRQLLTGARVKSMSLDMQAASLMTGSFALSGKQSSFTEAVIGGETFVAANSNATMNCVQSIQNILVDGAAPTTAGSIMSISLDIDNQHREQKGIGVLGNVGVKAGTLKISANLSIYFETKAQADKFTGNLPFALSLRLEDTNATTGTKAYIVTFPRMKYETLTADASGQDTDIMQEATAQATRDPTTNCMIQVDRFTI